MKYLEILSVVGVTLVIASTALGQLAGRTVSAATKPDTEWKDFPIRTIEDLPVEVMGKTDGGLSRYGGWLAQKRRATGFFRAEKIDGRWWLIDPEGGRFIHRGVASVRTTDTPGAVAALKAAFGGGTKWAGRTVELLRDHGFNCVSGWSDTDTLRSVERPLVYTRLWNFMSSYGKKRGGTYQLPGRTGYPNDCMFVFDPQFEIFCDEYAKQLAHTRNDPWLLGSFSDNELPFTLNALSNYLSLPAADPGGKAARQFLQSRHGDNATPADITSRDRTDFLSVVAERYCRIVSQAMKKYDPNHLYLGPRFHGLELLRCPEFFRASGEHLDVVSVNYYRVWTPERAQLEMWERASGRPILITEWYAKGADSGMPNFGGAGWLVKTQRERGLFYQNFALALLESKVCVGWDWFKYMDNDPDDKKVDPSNRDSNKGVVNNRYVPYEPLLDAMKDLNDRTYSLTHYFDRRPQAALLIKPGDQGD